MSKENKYKILYVDDEQINLNMFSRLFRRKYNIVTAASAKEALSLFDADSYHLVISDQRMPDVLGLDFLASIKKIAPLIPTVLLTGYTDYDVLQEAFNRSEVHRYINKPYDPQNLSTVIDLSISSFLLAEDKARMERELMLSEEKFRGIFNSMDDVFLRVDFDGIIKVVSPSVKELTDYTQEELLGKSIQSLYVNPKDQEELLLKVKKSDVVRDVDAVLLTKSGEKKYVSFTAKIIRNLDNEPIGVEKIARDVTLKKKMEQTVKEQNLLFEETQKIAQVGSWQLDLITGRALWSKTLCDIYGVESCEDVDNTLESYLSFIHPFERKKVNKIISQSINKGNDFAFDATVVRLDGAEKSISFLGKTFCDENRKVTKVTIACLDISQSKEREKELIRSEKKFRQLTEELPIRVLKTDKELNVMYSNKLMDKCSLTADYKASTLNLFLQKDVVVIILDALSKSKGSDKSIELEFKYKSDWYSLNYSKVDGDSEMGELLFLFDNITGKKESERILQDLNKELEAKVLERTKDLEEAKNSIENAYKKEKELSNLKTQFVSTASHQFRTPLTVIQSSIGLLEMQVQQVDPIFKEKFDRVNGRIVSEVKRMTDLMDNVLILGKKDSGAVTVKSQMTDVVHLINKVVEKHNQIQEDGREVKLTYGGPPSLCNLDPSIFENAVSNLISNAFKYSQGKQAPKVHLLFQKSGLTLTVEDFGIGISENELAHIFEPFYRAENVRDINGTGLGTSIVKAYVELLGGTVGVKSTEGKGSIFTINIEK